MARLPDDLLISELSIPGTHESHGFEGYSCWPFTYPWCSICQHLGLRFPGPDALTAREQLEGGVRALDIRLRHKGDQLLAQHGAQYLWAHFADICTEIDEDGYCSCGGILNGCIEFLQEHPGETILMRVKQTCAGCIGVPPCNPCMHCQGNTLSFAEAIEDYVARFDADYFYSWPFTECRAMPTLGDVRGKIVFLQDFSSDYHVGDGASNDNLASGRISCVGDFDGDLVADLAVINKHTPELHVFLNSGEGALTREPVVELPAGSPWSVSTGDLDGNGCDDLVLSLADESQVGVILRDPPGPRPMMRYDVGQDPREACVADFDQDGDQDLLVMNLNEGAGLASLLRNHGNGTFAPQELFEVGSHPRSVAVADLNGDVYPDLATAHSADDGPWDRYVKAWVNAGDGTFGPTSYWEHEVSSRWPDHVIAADFDGPMNYAEGIIAQGWNSAGQCNVPAPNSGFVDVAGGRVHSLGLKADSSIVAWGYNDSGQCTVPPPNASFVAVAGGVGTAGGGGDHSLGLKADGTVVGWGDNMYGQCDVPPPNTGFVAVAGGGKHSLGLKSDSTIVAWGDNAEGQLDVPSPNTGFVAVAGGAYHSLGLKGDSTIVAWGRSAEGQCDVPPAYSDFVDVAGGAFHSLGLRADGSIVAWGENADGQCDVPPPNTGFVAVAGGGRHSLGLKEDGTSVGWGDNQYQQCYVPAQDRVTVSAIAAGSDHSLSIVSGEFGLDDLAVSFPYGDLIEVYRNTGNGLTPGPSINASRPRGLAAADMDNDLHQDLVVVNRNSNDVTLHWNDGSSDFPDSLRIRWGVSPVGVNAADFDGDGDIDLAVTEYGPFDSDEGLPIWGLDRVSLQRNQDDGTTWCPANARGLYWGSLVIQDEYNVTNVGAKVDTIIGHLYAAWDGEPDDLYVNFLSGVNWPSGNTNCTTQPNEIAQVTNQATGEFLESFLKEGIVKRCGVLMADFPGYGVFDVVIGHNRFFDDIGAGLPGVQFASAAWGDSDNDGDLDILLTGLADSQVIALLYRNDGGDVFEEIDVGLAPVHSGSVAWGDYDNDGDLDILLTGNSGSGNVASVYRNDGENTFVYGAGLTPVSSSSAAWGDYDNDGDLDILLTGSSPPGPVASVYRNNAGSFSDIGAELTPVSSSSAAWGDYDNDGDLDILLAGRTESGGEISSVYRNDAGSFSDIGAGLPGVSLGSVAWGDYDNDGDLDILLTGYYSDGGYRISRVYRNDTGIFVDLGPGLVQAVDNSSVAWGDRDNDGDLDVLLTGYAGSQRISRVYLGDGSGGFGLGSFWPAQVDEGSIAWGDYDHDGDLDLALSGSTDSSSVARVYRNNIPNSNTPPAVPTNLSAQMTDSTLVFGWDPATDGQTAAAGLTYNLRVGTTQGGGEICAAMADPGTGTRRVAALGNVNHNLSWTIALPDPAPPTIFWSVQAIDACFEGSAFAPEQILGDLTGLPGVDPLPTTYALHEIAPNPFRASTVIRFDLPRAGPTRLEIFNVTGRRVRVLESGKMNPGRYAPVWDGRDGAGRAVSPGVYFVRLESGDFRATKKVVRTR
jgi:hypothetical protein